jgi:flagellar hook protein FlgE
MASTTAFYTGLSGLSVHARRLDVIGNNIANVNTTAYKSTRLELQNAFPRTMNPGTEPRQFLGGTNPYQVGLGVQIAGTTQNFSTGSITPTGDPRDLAIEGDGFFIVERAGDSFYTRNGAFRQDANDDLVTINGEKVMGFGVDADFNIVEGALTEINIPVGRLQISEPTTLVNYAGNLNAGGAVAQSGSLTNLFSTGTTGFRTTAGDIAGEATPLTSLADPSLGGALFASGDTLRIDGATRGGSRVPEAELAIGAGTTVADLLAFLNTSLGIHSTTTANPDGALPGATIDADGVIAIVGNTGTSATIALDSADLKRFDSDGVLAGLPFATANQAPSTGESDRTTTIVYDSLGNEVEVTVAFTLVSKNTNGTTWRYDLSSPDNAGAGPFLGTGEVSFDSLGELTSNDPITVSLSRAGTGAASPLAFNLQLSSGNGRMTALTDTPSQFAPVFRDGVPTGTLEQFGVDRDGTIIGAFDNGVTRTLGRVAVAKFINNNGLLDEGNALYRVGANSGPAIVTAPGEQAAGLITSGALELSNVDLGQEFIDLILTSTGYSASSRIIQTTDELMQQLLVIGR